GYRTRRSMINQETWNFANRTMGRIWMTWGLLLLVPSLLVLFFLKTGAVQNLEIWIVLLTLVQLAVLILSIFPVERALKANFDDKGRPRKPD
ncbi:MAG TPA: SdpI family protein, partial [Clostridia bacterium]|nr:SdpI family protein [Clostridia bacterium]